MHRSSCPDSVYGPGTQAPRQPQPGYGIKHPTSRPLLQQQDRLAVEPPKPCNHSEKPPGREVKGDDMVLADTVELTARTEPQSAGSSEPHGGVGCQHADKPSGGRVIFANVALALGKPNGHSLETTRLPPGAIARSRGLSSGSLTSLGLRSRPSRSNVVMVLSPSPEGPIPEDRYSWPPSPKPNPEGTERHRQAGAVRLRCRVGWQGQDRAAAPQGNAVAAVRCERAAAGVQALFTARVQSDIAVLVEREHPVIAAGDVDQITGRAQAQAARISDPGVVAEGPASSPSAEKQRSVPYPSPFAPLALVTRIRLMAV